MTRFYLIRHADAYNDEGIQLDDFNISENGQAQAEKLAQRLKDNTFDAMYCSKIQRSMDTCAAVNKLLNMDVIYDARLNEVGSDTWPQPGVKAHDQAINDFTEKSQAVFATFNELVEKHKNDSEVIIFTHGNWIRIVLANLLNSQNPVEAFQRFVIHNTSLNMVDLDEDGYLYVLGVSDAAHNALLA